MLIIGQDTTPEVVRDWIQDKLNQNDLQSVKHFLESNEYSSTKELWKGVIQHEFDINDHNGGRIHGNTLLHVAVRVTVKGEIIGSLLKPEVARDWIQDKLNQNDLQSVKHFLESNKYSSTKELLEGVMQLWEGVIQHEFDINDHNGGRIHGNTLLHVAVYVKVESWAIGHLLKDTEYSYAYLHRNSSGYTPLEFAGDLGNEYTYLYETIINGMVDWYAPIKEFVGTLLCSACSNSSTGDFMISEYRDKDGKMKYMTTVDLLLLPDAKGRNLCNDAGVISEEIEEFISKVEAERDLESENRSISIKTENTTVTFISDNKASLDILFEEAIRDKGDTPIHPIFDSESSLLHGEVAGEHEGDSASSSDWESSC